MIGDLPGLGVSLEDLWVLLGVGILNPVGRDRVTAWIQESYPPPQVRLSVVEQAQIREMHRNVAKRLNDIAAARMPRFTRESESFPAGIPQSESPISDLLAGGGAATTSSCDARVAQG